MSLAEESKEEPKKKRSKTPVAKKQKVDSDDETLKNAGKASKRRKIVKD